MLEPLNLLAVTDSRAHLPRELPPASRRRSAIVSVEERSISHVPMSQLTAFAEEMKNAGADYQLIVYGGNAMTWSVCWNGKSFDAARSNEAAGENAVATFAYRIMLNVKGLRGNHDET